MRFSSRNIIDPISARNFKWKLSWAFKKREIPPGIYYIGKLYNLRLLLHYKILL